MFLRRLTFIAAYPWLRLVAFLPFPILYGISSIIAIILFDVFKYRRAVIDENLEIAFPDLDKDEKRKIRRKFYFHFTDLFIESLKNGLMSNSTFKKRFQVRNVELVEQFAKENKGIVVLASHQGNWEWGFCMPEYVKIKCFAAYTKIGNKYFDKVLKDSRTKFGFVGYKTSETIKSMVQNFDNGIQGLYLLLSDQSPQIHKTNYWREFMGVKVPIHTGAEMLAKKFNMAVVNYSIKKIKRGFFEVTFEILTEEPTKFKNYEITDKYLAIVERNIRNQPSYYLWTHKRFKHRDKAPN